jgi:anti-anti-sigma factor
VAAPQADGGAPEATLTIAVVPDGNEVSLRLDGTLDLTTVTTFEECLDRLDPGVRTVAVDLSRVSFIDSTGVGALVRARNDLDVGLRRLGVSAASDRVRYVLEVSGVAGLLR